MPTVNMCLSDGDGERYRMAIYRSLRMRHPTRLPFLVSHSFGSESIVVQPAYRSGLSEGRS